MQQGAVEGARMLLLQTGLKLARSGGVACIWV
jgi:hypothetical protein